MPEENNSSPNLPGRPLGRPTIASMPMQRGNYGIPQRRIVSTAAQATAPSPAAPTAVAPAAAPLQVPQTTTGVAPAVGRVMDIAAPRPVAPVNVAQPTASPSAVIAPAAEQQPPAPIAPQPVQPTPAIRPITPTVTREPLFKPAPAAAPVKQRNKFKMVSSRLPLALLVIGGVLVLAGGVRFITGGNIAGYTVAVGAVVINDGHKTTMQFTADDGKLHRFTVNRSDRNLIPGTAVEIAYQPGASDATVKQVSTVNSARHLGILLALIGGSALAVGGFLRLLRLRGRKTAALPSQAVPVAA